MIILGSGENFAFALSICIMHFAYCILHLSQSFLFCICSVLDLVPDDALHVPYYEITENQLWRKEMANEITEAKFGNLVIEGFTTKELNVILEYVCTS